MSCPLYSPTFFAYARVCILFNKFILQNTDVLFTAVYFPKANVVQNL